jgi:uncharacterized SAM-binding protein YcdF (DUF218 family)
VRRVVGWLVLVVLAVAALAVVERAPLLRSVGGFLIVRDPPQPADAIVVLAGSIPDRILEAVDLYQAHLAPRIILTREPELPGLAALRARGGTLPEHHEQNQRIAEQLGVPAEAMTVLPTATASTFAEAQALIAYLRAQRIRSVLVVTSNAHARRARLTFRHLAGDGVRISVCPSRYDPFAPDTWWQQRAFVRRVVIEYGKLLTYLLVDRWRPRAAG